MIYIVWQGNVLEMAANDKITITDGADVTQYKMDYGNYVGDNVVIKNKKFSITGVVSNIKSFLLKKEPIENRGTNTGSIKVNQKNVSDYFELLSRIRDSREEVTLAFDPQIDSGGANDCIITNVTYTKSPKHGDAYMVDMSLEQVRRTQSATFTQRRETLSSPDQNQDEVRGGRKPTQEAPEPTESIGVSAIGGLFGLGD